MVWVIMILCGLWSLGAAVVIVVICIGASRYNRREEARARPWWAYLKGHWEK